MTESRFMRDWYVPVEIITLRSWLVVSFIVHLLLLTVEVLRDDSVSLLLGLIVCILFATLRASLPTIHDHVKRNVSLALSALIIGIGTFRLVSSSLSIFDIWMHAWTIIPSGLSHGGFQVGPLLFGLPTNCQHQLSNMVYLEILKRSRNTRNFQLILS